MEVNLKILEEELFSTLMGVKDGSVEINKAKTVVDISSKIVDVKKVQLEAVRIASAMEDFQDGARVLKNLGIVGNGAKQLTNKNKSELYGEK